MNDEFLTVQRSAFRIHRFGSALFNQNGEWIVKVNDARLATSAGKQIDFPP